MYTHLFSILNFNSQMLRLSQCNNDSVFDLIRRELRLRILSMKKDSVQVTLLPTHLLC